ncbi:MAG TPA: hypothetical protein VHP12_05020 [Chitinophagaceae bacterium]|nr:hypothetical protein [Chitinophagaceae bacterium]
MKQYHIVSRIAIYSLAVILIIFGIFHFLKPHELVIYIPTFLPGGIVWTYLVGASFIVTGLSFITNNYVKWAGYLLAILLTFFVFAVHLPNALHAGDSEMKTLAFINFFKDAAIACFALHIAAGAHHQHLHLEESD